MEAGTFLLELGAILLALAGAARLSGWAGISPIPLYLLVGLALGEGGLVPVVTAEPFIEVGAQLGVILLLLMLGLEYSPEELVGGLRTSLPVAVVDLVLNATPGALAGLLFGWGPTGAVVLAGVTYISSSSIVAKVVGDLGWLANRETPMVLSLLVAEDLAMAVYLPLLAVLLAGGGAAGTAWLAAPVAVGAAGVALLVAVRFTAPISRALATRSAEGLILGILGVTLLVAGAAEELRVSAAIGAFFVGIAFSGQIQEQARGVLVPLRDLFAAIFFLFFGLEVDPGSIPPVAGGAVILAGITAATKAGTAWWGGHRLGIGTPGRWRATASLVSRGEFSIVIAELGAAAAVHPDLGPLAAAYVLLLAAASPVLARLTP